MQLGVRGLDGESVVSWLTGILGGGERQGEAAETVCVAGGAWCG